MSVKEILLLGNEELYEVSTPINDENIDDLVNDLHDTLMDFRKKYQAGRAIAAPQIGVKKRLIYMYIDKPIVFINPRLEFIDDELIEVMDDCMSFPDLLVKVMRYKKCKIKYFDENGKEKELYFEDDLAELIQHEYDHLDGILATMKAIDNKSFILKGALKWKN